MRFQEKMSERQVRSLWFPRFDQPAPQSGGDVLMPKGSFHPTSSAISASSTSTKRQRDEIVVRDRIVEIPASKRVKRRFSGPDIQVLVGPAKARFTVNRDLICEQSDFFKRASTIGMKESESGLVQLPEASANSFALYRDFLFNGCIATQDDCTTSEQHTDETQKTLNQSSPLKNLTNTKSSNDASPEVNEFPAWDQLMEFYALADFLGDDTAKNVAASQIVVVYNKALPTSVCLPPPAAINIAYQRLTCKSPMRQLLLDACFHCKDQSGVRKWFKGHRTDFVKEFVWDFVDASFEGDPRRPRRGMTLVYSDYHVHKVED